MGRSETCPSRSSFVSLGGDAHVESQLARDCGLLLVWCLSARLKARPGAKVVRTGIPTCPDIYGVVSDGKVFLLVVAVTVSAASVQCSRVLGTAVPFPGWWPIGTFVFVATLLESFNTRLRIAARARPPSSFTWLPLCSLVAGGRPQSRASPLSLERWFAQTLRIKATFNVSQRILSVSLAVMVYRAWVANFPLPIWSVSSRSSRMQCSEI